MFLKVQPFKSSLCNKANWYVSRMRCSLHQLHIFMPDPLKTQCLRKECKLSLIFKDGLQGVPLFSKDALRQGCACADLSEAPAGPFHAAQLSGCWKYGQTVTSRTLILMLSPPTVLSSSPASRSTLPPADTAQLPAVPGFEVGASQLVRGIIKWK